MSLVLQQTQGKLTIKSIHAFKDFAFTEKKEEMCNQERD
jgi:hypothetical protein